MGKIYNIVLNSNNGAGGTNAKTYYYDWSLIPEGRYKCSFSYVGSAQTLNVVTNAKIYLDLGQIKQYEPQLQTSGSVGKFIGCLKSEIAIYPLFASGTGSISGTTMTITAMTDGPFFSRMTISSDTAGVTANSLIASLGTTGGGTGAYTLNNSSTLTGPAQIYGITLPSYILIADSTMNEPFYLDNRPSSNAFTCNILNYNNTSWSDSVGTSPASYILTLNMELLD